MTSPKSAKFLAGVGPLSILRMLWKRKLVIILLWILVSGIAVGLAWKLPAIYSAEALILVDSQKIPEKYVSSTVSTDVQDRLATISQQILSSTRLKKIIDDFDLYKDEKKNHVQEEILDMMRRDISIKVDKGWTGNRPGAFRIGYQGPDPAIVAQVANRVANLYIEENLKTREVQAEGTSEFIDTQLEEAKKRLDELEGAVSDYKLKHNGELPQQESAISGTLSRLQIELQNNRDALGRAQESKLVLENTLKVAEATVAALSTPELPAAEDAPRPVAGLPVASGSLPVKASDQIKAQMEVLRLRGYSDTHPDMKKLSAEFSRVQKLESQPQAEESRPAPPKTEQAARTTETPKPPVRRATPRQAVELGQALERVTTLKSNLAIVVKEIEQRTADQQRILREMSGAQNRLERLPIHEQDLAKITRDYEISKANYRSLLDKKFSAEMATDMEHRQKSERFTIIDPARVPEKPISPNRPLLGGGGSIFGLVIGLAVGVGAELRKNVVLGEWELPAGVPVLGRLPYIVPMLAEPEPPSGGKIGRMVRSRKFRLAIISSAVLSCLAITAAGIYFLRTRF